MDNKQKIRILAEIIPVIAFLMSYALFNIHIATAVITILSPISLLLVFLLYRKVPYLMLLSSGMIMILGILTIYTGDTVFIKTKPTLINLFLASVLTFGIMKNKPVIKMVFKGVYNMPNSSWIEFSKRWVFFFLTMAIVNELVWRNMSEATWVNFKVFGIFILTLIFYFLQTPFLKKNSTNNLSTQDHE